MRRHPEEKLLFNIGVDFAGARFDQNLAVPFFESLRKFHLIG
jgi:hypothetical protein